MNQRGRRLINYADGRTKTPVFTPHTFHTWGFQTCAARVAGGHLFPHWLLVAQLTHVVRPCAAHVALLKRGKEREREWWEGGSKEIEQFICTIINWFQDVHMYFNAFRLNPEISKKCLSGYLFAWLQKEFHSDNVWTTTGLVRSITADYFISRLCQTRTGLGANHIRLHCPLCELVIPLCIVFIFQMALNKHRCHRWWFP